LLSALRLLGVFAVIVFVAVTIEGPRESPLPKSSTDIGEMHVGRIMLQPFGDKCHRLLVDNGTGKTVRSAAACPEKKIVSGETDSRDRFSSVSNTFSNR
jgi:hypothetical protein